MFFVPDYLKKTGNERVFFSRTTAIKIEDSAVSEYIKSSLSETFGKKEPNKRGMQCKKIVFEKSIPERLKDRLANDNGEGFAVETGEISRIYSNTDRGLVYGLHTLIRLAEEKKCFKGSLLVDSPVCVDRGYRVYLPGRENIPYFKKMIDFLAEYRYNKVILEIGGAMEYKRHPEINEKWVEFCKEVYSDPNRAEVIQRRTYPWEKNSIHCENGDGGVLTQDECRDIAEYCASRGIEVVPEVPTLSHADYICLAHPEIAERQDDAYPDTYCPNHPDTYKYVFDVIDEVIEVFRPKQIHIGHDEAYTLGVCDRCKHTNPVDLYVYDINKINGYLKQKGIKASMWAEKLLKAFTASGTPIGGNANGGFKNGGQWSCPPLWRCRDLLPKDMKYIHWYWEFGDHHDRVYHDREYDMSFGNLSALFIDNWKKRIEWGAKGGWVSNWGSFEREYMQRNLQYFKLISGSYAFWNREFDSENKKKTLKNTFKEAYRFGNRDKKSVIKIRHRTDKGMPHEYFWCGVFIEDEKYLIGRYEVTYTDGAKAYLPVKYGTNIGCRSMAGYPLSKELMQLASEVLPIGENGDMFYECSYENPYPEKTVESIEYIPIKPEFDVEYTV